MASGNVLLIFPQEFLNRVLVGLGEVASKFSVPVIQDIEKQIAAAETGLKTWVDVVEAHITGIKLKAAVAAAAGQGTATAGTPPAVVPSDPATVASPGQFDGGREARNQQAEAAMASAKVCVPPPSAPVDTQPAA